MYFNNPEVFTLNGNLNFLTEKENLFGIFKACKLKVKILNVPNMNKYRPKKLKWEETTGGIR